MNHPSFAQLPAYSAQALFIKYFRKILFPSHTAEHAMFNTCAQNAHSALSTSCLEESHSRLWDHEISSLSLCHRGCWLALMAEPRLVHTAFSPRKLLSGSVSSKARGWLEHSPQMQCQACQQWAPRPEKQSLLPLPPAAFQEGNRVVSTPSLSLSKDNGTRLEPKKAWEATSLTSHVRETELGISGSPHDNSVSSS